MWFKLGARPLEDWESPDSRIYRGRPRALCLRSLFSLSNPARRKAGHERAKPCGFEFCGFEHVQRAAAKMCRLRITICGCRGVAAQQPVQWRRGDSHQQVRLVEDFESASRETGPGTNFGALLRLLLETQLD